MWRRLLFRNFSLLHRINHWLRHRFTPTGFLILGGMISAATFGINTRQSLAFQIFAITASLLLVSFCGTIYLRGRFRILRRLPNFGTVGLKLNYQIVVENSGARLQQELLIIDELEAAMPDFNEFSTSRDPSDMSRNWFDRVIGYPRLMALIRQKRGASIAPAAVPELPANDETELQITLTPERRGYLRFDRSRLARPGPLGLLRAIQNHANPDSLLILPKIYRVPYVRMKGTRKYQTGGMNLASTVGDSQEFKSLRDYRPGDPLRAIHWRSYAKKREPVVKEFQDEFFVRQGIILDTFKENRSEAVFEEAVSVTASFAVAIQDQDSLLDLMFVGTQAYRFTSGRGLAKAENMLEILACVEPNWEESFHQLVKLVLQHANETSGLIFVLLDWDDKRRALVKRITTLGIPALVLLIAEEGDAGRFEEQSDNNNANVVVLQCGRIQAGLEKIDINRLK